MYKQNGLSLKASVLGSLRVFKIGLFPILVRVRQSPKNQEMKSLNLINSKHYKTESGETVVLPEESNTCMFPQF